MRGTGLPTPSLAALAAQVIFLPSMEHYRVLSLLGLLATTRATHGALPHRAPSPIRVGALLQCDPMHHVWHRRPRTRRSTC